MDQNQQNNSNINRILDKVDRLDEKFDRKIEKVDKRLDSVEKELAIYNEQLKHHIEGVRQLKRENEMLREYIDLETTKLEHAFEPVITHVDSLKNGLINLKKMGQWVSYLVTIFATVAGLVYTVMQILGK